MKLQKNTRLALYSVLEFAARPDEHVPASEVAQSYGESVHHLAKVLSELARAGIVEAVRGVGGGYRFVANPRRLTLLDVIELFEDPSGEAPRAGDAVSAVDRALGEVWDEIDQNTRATLGSITVATLLRMIERGGRPSPGGLERQERPPRQEPLAAGTARAVEGD